MIVVLGMHRSGTSLVAGLLHHLGVFMGDEFASGENLWCPYEDPAFVSLNQQILTAAGGSWRKPPSIEAIWRASHPFNERIQRLIRDRSSHYDLWGWKDPRTCLTVALWHHHITLWSNPHYVMVWRERGKIIASLLQRAKNSGDIDLSELGLAQLTGFYWARVLNFIAINHPQYHPVWYDQLIDPSTAEQAIIDLTKFIGVSYDPSVLSFIHNRKPESGNEDPDCH